MSTRLLIGSFLLAISAGCAVDAGDEPQVSTREDDVQIYCGAVNFREEYFSEPEMINLVGTRACTCYNFERFTGEITAYGRLHHKFTCDLN